MAEERLIDDDKDRKYKIRVNEDGEEELIIAPQTAAEEAAEIDFEVPDFDDDDEEARGRGGSPRKKGCGVCPARKKMP